VRPPSKWAGVNWERLAVIAAVVAVTTVVARIVDRRIARRELEPTTATRYRVLRRSITSAIAVVGLLSALLLIPQVRVLAGSVLASGAVLALVIGFAAQRTLSNFVAGILIAFTQPVRIRDRVEVDGRTGVVEEIGLTYTFIRLDDASRLVIPNDKLASDTIRNSTIRSREKVAEITVRVPLNQDLGALVELLRAETGADVVVSGLDGDAALTIRAEAPDETAADRLADDLRLRVHKRLRAAGVWA
jgi:small-conductance mechanosensitive channel